MIVLQQLPGAVAPPPREPPRFAPRRVFITRGTLRHGGIRQAAADAPWCAKAPVPKESLTKKRAVRASNSAFVTQEIHELDGPRSAWLLPMRPPLPLQKLPPPQGLWPLPRRGQRSRTRRSFPLLQPSLLPQSLPSRLHCCRNPSPRTIGPTSHVGCRHAGRQGEQPRQPWRLRRQHPLPLRAPLAPRPRGR